MIKVIIPPHTINNHLETAYRLFLAGSIEMGKAIDWQSTTISYLEAETSKTQCSTCLSKLRHNLTVYNPRRPDWDSNWTQDIESGPFYRQVSWELSALERSTHILFYLAPDTLSPISLLELGRFAGVVGKKIVVVVDDKYLRKGNVDIFCERYNIPQVATIEKGLKYLFHAGIY